MLSGVASPISEAVQVQADEVPSETANQSFSESTGLVSYQTQVEPILRHNCFGCHQGAKQQGSYNMTDFASLIVGGESENVAIVPGKPGKSNLLDQITPTDGHAEMPKSLGGAKAKPLDDVEIELITTWIKQGAVNDSPADDGPRYSPEHPPVYAGAPTLSSIDVSADKLIAVAGFHEVLILKQDGSLKSRMIGLSPRINSVRFSPDGKRLAAVGGTPAVGGEVQIWEVESGELSLSLPITFDTLSGASWSPDGTKLAFGATDNVLRVIDTTSGEQVMYQGAHEDWVRDTTFTPDGTHVISVARDMTCKLTEVETERFIDNITSITPGALSGGMSSVATHPERTEVLVGGSDGVPKLYRVFRETARKIGDDANLIRSMPEMPGRIFSVHISPDGTRLAAAATLNGKSEVRVWKYDFDGKLPDEFKKIIAKRVADRSANEKKKLDAHRAKSTEQVFEFKVDDAAVYAIRFANDNSLFVADGKGVIRHIGDEGKLIKAFPAIAIDEDSGIARLNFDPQAWNAELATKATATSKETTSTKDIQRLVVTPAIAQFESPYAYTQLVVTAITKSGETMDVTRLVTIDAPDWITKTAGGLLRASEDGKGEITVSLGKQEQRIKVVAQHVSPSDADSGSVDFIRDVNPVLSRLGCNQGTCHGAQKGKNGFKLSLRGYDPVFDLRALTDDLAARRINPAAPNESLMLRKPLGETPHQGGSLMTPADPNHIILHRWIADGSQVDFDTPRVERLEVFPVNPTVQSTTAKQQVRVVAHYPDGSQRDVTQEAFIDSGNTEVATSATGGLLSAVRRGEAPILARYEGAYAATTLTVMGDRSGYEKPTVPTWDPIDELVAAKWDRVKVTPSDLCDDSTYLRRVHLDLTGLPPSSQVVREFLKDKTPTREKRAKVVDNLLGSPAYVDYWTNKWADLLQVNRKFLGVEGSQKFRDWIRAAVQENRPYNEFAHQILTASGSNNDNPAASYFKVLREPDATMENTTHLFLGIRFNCNKCHDHPFERWTQDQYYQMSAYFAQVKLENDPASGARKIGGTAVEGAKPLFEKVVDEKDGEVKHARTNEVVAPMFPFLVEHDEPTKGTRREKLAQWMVDADNPYFARSYVNRLWGYLLGVGLIEPIDDIRAGNPPTNPDLLDHLTESFVESDFDTKEMLRKICNSRTYQLSVQTNELNADDSQNYSHALPRRLPAEVIYDAVHSVTGATSAIPGLPAGTRAAAIPDSGVKLADGFLQNLGRPVRESACECERNSDLQLGPVMALISGPTIGTAIADPKNELDRMVQEFDDDADLAEEIFLRALGRPPSDLELDVFAEMQSLIKLDHAAIVDELQAAEEVWVSRKKTLEAKRLESLASVKEAVDKRTEAIKAERAKLTKQREDRVKVAERIALRMSDHVVALSEVVADELVTYCGVPREKISVIPPGVDSGDFRPRQASEVSSLRKLCGIQEGDRTMLAAFVGEIRTNRKNLDLIFEAMTECADFQLAVVGADEASSYPRMAAKLGIADRVTFLGQRSDVAGLMRGADAFVFPTHYEPYGIVVTEAMASGLPVVVTRNAGSACVVTHGRDGFLLEDGADLAGLVDAIRRLGDPQVRQTMGQAARAAAEALTWERMVDAYVPLLADG